MYLRRASEGNNKCRSVFFFFPQSMVVLSPSSLRLRGQGNFETARDLIEKQSVIREEQKLGNSLLNPFRTHKYTAPCT